MKSFKQFLESEDVIKIGYKKDPKVQKFIDDLYAKYPKHPLNPRQFAMVWGEGEEQELAFFELKPSAHPGAVEVDWFQAYPQRQGVGSRAMKELQDLAQKDGIALTLYPWDKGRVSQTKLIKFYKSHGFKPVAKGQKAMKWEPTE